MGEKKLCRSQSSPIPYFKSIPRERETSALSFNCCTKCTFLIQVNHNREQGKPKKLKKLLHSRITRGLRQLYSLVGFGRPLFEGGGINNPDGTLESGELLGVSVMEEISKQGGESSLLHQKKVEGLWNICSSLSHFMCSSWKGIRERENTLRNRMW